MDLAATLRRWVYRGEDRGAEEELWTLVRSQPEPRERERGAPANRVRRVRGTGTRVRREVEEASGGGAGVVSGAATPV